MNWYKYIKFSSNNLKFPQNIEEQIDRISNECVKYYFSKEDKPIIEESFNFINPYSQEKDNIPVIIHPLTNEFKNTTALFNPQKRSLSIFPYHHNLQNVNKNSLLNYIKQYIYHELSHAIDPKFLIKDWWRNRKNVDYLLREEEFDAYSKQIEYIIQNNINEKNIENLKTWLRTNDTNLIPNYLNNYKEIIQYWQGNKPIYIKKLKQRIYNSFIGRPNNAVHNT
jgi:hypothetical protein